MATLKVSTRMYRVNELGDCFLLRFEANNKKSSVLIDCGSFRNSKESIARMKEIAANISETVGKDGLSAVVGTHQHNDHLSGFTHAADTWMKLTAKEGWLSWLDNPEDKNAAAISDDHKKLTGTLNEVNKALLASKNIRFAKDDETNKIADVLGFYIGLTDNEEPIVPAMGLQMIRKMSKKTTYLSPGDVFDLPDLDAGQVKVYVLGPPKDKKLLFDISAGKGESYDPKLAMANTMASNYLEALSNFSENGSANSSEAYFPFDKKFTCNTTTEPFTSSQYNHASEAWRKVDTDWLQQAERLGLYLDSYTNNTSLVLAFELIESGKVLLFVGDAQTGNWLSWKDIDWKEQAARINFEKLMAKTVLYKVGHHCSHNATLVAGLEDMTHPDLVAMIPVDKTDPNITKKNGWKMPAAKLHQRLKEKAKNRVLRMDDVFDSDCDPKDNQIKKSWKSLNLPVVTNLFIEYTIDA